MTRDEAIRVLQSEQARCNERTSLNQANYFVSDEAYNIAIEALKTLDELTSIIVSPLYIQEDVFRYKMICNAMEKYL